PPDPGDQNGSSRVLFMLATLGGSLALAIGVAVLLLPLLVNELSRPRDAVWGGVVLLLGLVLVTSAERLTGAPMLAVLCGGLLIGRLGTEVGQGRWNQLSGEERSALATPQRWVSGLQQLSAASARLLLTARELGGGLASWLAARRQPKASGKRWVRPEAEVEADREAEGAAETPPTGALRGTGPDNTSEEPAATSSPSPPAQHEPSAQREPADHLEPSDQQGPAEGFSGPDQPAGLAAEAAAAPQAMPSPQAPDPAPASEAEAEAETETETVEVEILDPPPPQRSVPDFHAIDALLRASGALPSPGPAEPPLAEAELEPEDGFRGA
ncbi:MAG: Ycf66 family protein, partial [Cyanobium sp.]